MIDYSNIGNNMLLKMYYMLEDELSNLHSDFGKDEYKLYHVYITDFAKMDYRDLDFKHWAGQFVKVEEVFSDQDKIFFIPITEHDTMLKLHTLVVEYHALYGYKVYDVLGHDSKKEVYCCENYNHLIKYLSKVQLYINEIKPNSLDDWWEKSMNLLFGESEDIK